MAKVPKFHFAILWTAKKDQQMQVTEIRIPARNQPISSLRCDYITQATKQVCSADRENNRYCNGNVVEQFHNQLASRSGRGTAHRLTRTSSATPAENEHRCEFSLGSHRKARNKSGRCWLQHL